MSSAWTPVTSAPPPNGVPAPPVHHIEVPAHHNIDSAHPTAAESSPDSNNGDDDLSNDAEGVWSPDIEQSFQEALAIYPPCGRRKIILSDEGKMYGRNELIARYIKVRTGKTRTRKQVSSHIQVLARRKAKEIQAQIKDHSTKEKMLLALAAMSSAQIVSASGARAGTSGHVPTGARHPGAMSLPPPLPSTSTQGAQDHTSKDKVLQTMANMSSAQIVSVSAMQNRVGHGGHAGPPPPPPGASEYGSQDHGQRDRALSTMASMSSAQIVSATALQQHKMPPQPSAAVPQPQAGMGSQPNHQPPVNSIKQSPPSPTTGLWNRGVGIGQDIKPFGPGYELNKASSASELGPPWIGRSIAGPKLRLVEFSAFLEQQRDPEAYHKHLFVHIGAPSSHADPLLEAVDIRQIYDKFPEKKGGLKQLYDDGPTSAFFLVKFWADLNTNVQDEAGAYYGVSSVYENTENVTIQCSTKVCSFGKQVVEKLETEYPRMENGRFVYRIHRSPMCEYMINFIHKLKHLPEKYMMNSVLENFTILQVVTNMDTQETLLCIAYVFEVSTSEHGAQHHIYRLVKD